MSNVSSLEKLNLNVTGAQVIDAANLASLTDVTAVSNNTLAINNLGSLPTVNLSSTNTTTLNVLNSALAGTNNLTLNLTGGQTGAITVTDTAGANTLETLAVNSSSTNTLANLTVSGLGATKLTIGGSGQLTVTALTDAESTLKTIDGSSSTGGFSITAVNGGATVLGGSGNDSLTAGNGNDSISAGAGNDSITFAAGTITANDTVDGGEGVNTIVLAVADADTTTALTRVTNIQTMQLSTLLNGETITTANTATSINRINIDVQGGGATFNFGAGESTVGFNIANALSGNNTLTVDAAGVGTSDSLTLVNMLAAGSALAATSDLVVTDYETVTFNSGSTSSTAQLIDTLNAGTAAVSITGVNGLTTTGAITAATINASGLTGTGALNMGAAAGAGLTSITGSSNGDVLRGDISSSISGGAGNDSIFGGTGNDTLLGEAGNDTIAGGTGNDSIDAGEGNDTVQFATLELTANDTVSGGDGTLDVLSYTTYANADDAVVAMARVSNFEVIQVAGMGGNAQTLTMSNFGNNAGFTRVNLGDLTSVGAGRGVAISNASSSLNQMNIVAAQSQADGTVSFARLTDTTTDTLTISNAITAGAAVTFGAITASNEETINISGSIAANTITVTAMTAADLQTLNITGAANISLASGAGIVSATNLTTIDASAATGNVTVNATNSTVNMTVTAGTGVATITTGSGADSITGNVSNDVFVAGAGADTVNGGAGDDSITGGRGSDSLTGGTGADDFIYVATNDGGNVTAVGVGAIVTAGDTIVDFVSGTDDIDVAAVTTVAATGAGASGSWDMSADGAYIITTSFNFQLGSSTTQDVATAIGAVTNGAARNSVVAIFDDQGTASTADDVYNLFQIVKDAATSATAIEGADTISLLGVINSRTFVEGDFIV